MSSAGRPKFSGNLRDAGTLRSQLLDHSKSYILMEVVAQKFHMVQWTHKILLRGVIQALLTPYSMKDSGLTIFANGERSLVWMAL